MGAICLSRMTCHSNHRNIAFHPYTELNLTISPPFYVRMSFFFSLYPPACPPRLLSLSPRPYIIYLSAQYFPNTAWPSSSAVAPECGNDPLFLALYDELTLRHLQSVKRPSVRDRVGGWRTYARLFDLILAESALDGGDESKKETLYLVPEWCFDLMHEFLYQFQGFCQFRTATYAAAAKSSSSSSDAAEKGGPAGHVADAIDVLSQNRDAWAVESVLSYLRRLVSAGTKSGGVAPVYRFLAYFGSVTLSRLECLLGDYRASVSALDVVYDPDAELVAVGEDMKSPEELVNGVFPARLSLAYHAGVSYLMLRRYRDSATVLGGICLFMQRGFKVSFALRCGAVRCAVREVEAE